MGFCAAILAPYLARVLEYLELQPTCIGIQTRNHGDSCVDSISLIVFLTSLP